MAIRWRVKPLLLLKEKGYSTYRIRKEAIFSESTVQSMRLEKHISFKDLDTLCKLTGKQPGKLISYVPDDDTTPT